MTFALFSLWTFVILGRPQDLIPALAPLRPALLMTVLTVVVVFFGRMLTIFESMRSTPEARRYLIFFAIMILGIPFAYHRRVAFEFTFIYYLINILFFLVFVTLVDSVTRLKKILWVVTLCTLFYSVGGLILGTFTPGRFQISGFEQGRFQIFGLMFDPNDIAYVLITLLPLSLFFIVQPEGVIKKILALVGAGASLVVILLTGSRGGFLGLAVVVVLLLLTQAGTLKKRHKVALLAGIALAVIVNIDQINVERYLTLTDIEEDYNFTDETGRIQVWKRAIELFLIYPFTGVGANCFPMAIGYVRADANLKPIWQAVHNSYLQIAVETGVVGVGVFISLILGCLRTFSTGRKQEGSSAEGRQLNVIAGSLQAGFIGSLICASFLSQGYSIYFTLYFAFSAVMRKLIAELVVSEKSREGFHTQRGPVLQRAVGGRGMRRASNE